MNKAHKDKAATQGPMGELDERAHKEQEDPKEIRVKMGCKVHLVRMEQQEEGEQLVHLDAVEPPVRRGCREKTVALALQANRVPKVKEVILVKMAQLVQLESKENRALMVHEDPRETEATVDNGASLGRREASAAEEELGLREQKAPRENEEARVPSVPRVMQVPKDLQETMDRTAFQVKTENLEHEEPRDSLDPRDPPANQARLVNRDQTANRDTAEDKAPLANLALLVPRESLAPMALMEKLEMTVQGADKDPKECVETKARGEHPEQTATVDQAALLERKENRERLEKREAKVSKDHKVTWDLLVELDWQERREEQERRVTLGAKVETEKMEKEGRRVLKVRKERRVTLASEG